MELYLTSTKLSSPQTCTFNSSSELPICLLQIQSVQEVCESVSYHSYDALYTTRAMSLACHVQPHNPSSLCTHFPLTTSFRFHNSHTEHRPYVSKPLSHF